MNVSKHFTRAEFACKCPDDCGYTAVDSELLVVLESIREHYQAPITITSAHRCPEWNKEVGGKPNSFHLKAMAVDFVVKGVNPRDVYDYLNRVFVDKYGIGNYQDFTHLDARPYRARWNG